MNQLLIVGGGLAGTLLSLECYERGISFTWLTTDQLPAASNAAYGICNPVHIRNRVLTWKAEELLEWSVESFKNRSKWLNVDAYFTMPVNHLINDEDELVGWRQHAETTALWKYSDGEPRHEFHSLLSDSFVAEVKINGCFYLNVSMFIQAAKNRLADYMLDAEINWSELKDLKDHVSYQGKNYSKVIIADGSYATNNPFWNYIPFNLCKGEVLKVRIKGLKIKEAIHKKLMLIPLHDEVFICGATYEWKDLSFHVSEAGKDELLNQLKLIIGSKYEVEVLEHKAGVRPTMPDRRPVVGWHPVHKNIGVMNGLGTKGLILGPSAAKNLIDHMESGEPIWADWDVKRFNKRFEKISNKV